MPESAREHWVFGYGSLMWRPGFSFVEVRRARLDGFHRAFCISSVHYRGTAKRPGLVLGLDRGGACEGVAFRLDPETGAEALSYLRARELIYAVYREALQPVVLVPTADELRLGVLPRTVLSYCYIADRAHPAYAGRLGLAAQVLRIRGAQGAAGTNLDYLCNTLCHLDEMGIVETRLRRLGVLAGGFVARGTVDAGVRARAQSMARSFARQPIRRPVVVEDNRFGYRAKIAALAERGGG